MIRNASSLNTNHTMELVPYLKKIKMPTLLLWEDEDKEELEFGQRLHKDIKMSKFVRIPKAGHYALVDQEEVVLEKTLSFLKGQMK
ncbi:MAG: alpha/beta fold hydrolase [Nitrosopumilus sp.]